MRNLQIPIFFLKRERRAGDLVKSALDRAGIRQKPGCKCKQIQEALNKVVFAPKGRA